MSVGKAVLDNINKHFMIRMQECKGILVIAIQLGVLFLNDAVNLIRKVSSLQSEPELITCSVYTNWALITIAIACIYYTITETEYNERHQIYPHTPTTQLVSFQLYLWVMNGLLQLMALGLYLLQYLLCVILDHWKGNVETAYRFQIPFIAVGFVVNLLYGFLIIALITFIASVIRRLRWWSIAVLGVIWISLWLTKDRDPFGLILHFYLKNTSILLFIGKAIITLIVMSSINFYVNRITDQQKAKNFHTPQIIIASIIMITVCLSIIITFSKVNSISDDTGTSYSFHDINVTKEKAICELDAGKLPAKSSLKINWDFVRKSHYAYRVEYSNSTEDKIQIYFQPEQEVTNSINITSFIHPRIKASLKDNNLNIRVDYHKNIKVVSLYPYSTLMQFDLFRDKSYAKQFIGSRFGTVPGNIVITLPKGKQFETIDQNGNLPSYSIGTNTLF